METTDTPPEQLSERELFSEFVELTDEPDGSREGYREAHLRARRADLIAEIGERLEALEATKALIGDAGSEHDTTPGSEQPDKENLR